MVSNETARTNFANNVKNVLDKYNMDGVDLDFEWAYSPSELTNYSKAIVKLRGVLGKNVFFTVSLHPVSYKITSEAIAAVDFISFQCYGPQAALFSFERFKSDGQTAVEYGIPQNKLVMGVPFYGTTGTAGEIKVILLTLLWMNGCIMERTIHSIVRIQFAKKHSMCVRMVSVE